MSDNETLEKMLRLIISQGQGEAIIFRLEAVADLLSCPLEEVIDDLESGRMPCKRMSGPRIMWRMSTYDLLKYLQYRSPGED